MCKTSLCQELSTCHSSFRLAALKLLWRQLLEPLKSADRSPVQKFVLLTEHKWKCGMLHPCLLSLGTHWNALLGAMECVPSHFQCIPKCFSLFQLHCPGTSYVGHGTIISQWQHHHIFMSVSALSCVSHGTVMSAHALSQSNHDNIMLIKAPSCRSWHCHMLVTAPWLSATAQSWTLQDRKRVVEFLVMGGNWFDVKRTALPAPLPFLRCHGFISLTCYLQETLHTCTILWHVSRKKHCSELLWIQSDTKHLIS